MYFRVQIRRDLFEILLHCFCFALSYLCSLILLPVKITDIYIVEINQDQLTNPGPGKGFGNVRAKPSQTTDCHHC